MVDPCRRFPLPSISWPTVHFLHYTRTTYVAFGNRIIYRGIKLQVLLGGKRTIS
jgi:hypothetical protein